MTRPTDLSVADAGAGLRQGDFSAVELTEAHLERIAALDPDIRAFVTVLEERALAAAAAADRDFRAGRDRGPMQGIPFAVKDLLDVEGVVTGCGSNAGGGEAASRSADVVLRLQSAGAVLLGKLATYEFALNGPSFDGPAPPPRNPWNRDHITGGSSSGSAAAVAAGLLRVAIGTDTGGSIRSPSGYCGIAGLKPTFGRLPMADVFPLSPTLDHVGPMAATVADAALAFAAMASAPPVDTAPGQGLTGLRIGYARDWFAHDPSATADTVVAMDAAVAELSMSGCAVELIDLPDYADIEAAGAVVLHAEALETHRAGLAERGARYGRLAYRSLIAGVSLTAGDVALARRAGRRFREEIDALLTGFDAIVTVNTLAPAPRFSSFADGRTVWTPMRTLPFNVSGHPVLAQPVGFADGLPVGMQIVGRHGADSTILRIGAAYEAATDPSAQRPYLPYLPA